MPRFIAEPAPYAAIDFAALRASLATTLRRIALYLDRPAAA